MDEVRFSPYNLTKAKKNLEEIQNQTAIGKIEKRWKINRNVSKCLEMPRNKSPNKKWKK